MAEKRMDLQNNHHGEDGSTKKAISYVRNLFYQW